MPEIQTLQISTDYAKFVLEPLERGYGQTIGNALRRVLLSSIAGAAVQAVRIEKVFHEFAAIPGLKEDTTEFLLNLKDLAIRISPEFEMPDEIVLNIDVKGPGQVTAADIKCPEGIEIMNKSLYLATISDKGESLRAELFVGWGTGYVLPEKQEKYKGTLGILTTGSQFTPVRKVNYIVEQTRVGQRTDYDRLILEVSTNGALPPNDAVTQAAHILDKYFRLFFELGNLNQNEPLELGSLLEEDMEHIPDVTIAEMELSSRTTNCLKRVGIDTLRQLAKTSEAELLAVKGLGKTSLSEIRDKLEEMDVEIPLTKSRFNIADFEDEDEE